MKLSAYFSQKVEIKIDSNTFANSWIRNSGSSFLVRYDSSSHSF